MYADGSYRLSDKWLKGTSLEELCHIDDTKWVPDGPAVLPLVELLLFPEFTVPEVSVLPVVGVVEVVVPVVPVVPETTPGPPAVIVPEVAFPVPEVPG